MQFPLPLRERARVRGRRKPLITALPDYLVTASREPITMSFSVIIPARYSSSRLPGKPLLDIAGKPMIQHVYERALHSEAREVVIATDDTRIVKAAARVGAKVSMTSPDQRCGTERLEETGSRGCYYADDIVVNVQGDEPLIPPRVINQVAH